MKFLGPAASTASDVLTKGAADSLYTATGTTLKYKGAWASGSYSLNDVVTYNGKLYGCTTAVVAGGYAAAVTADSPVSFWEFNEGSGTTSADAQGIEPLTFSAAPTWTTGPVGNAVTLSTQHATPSPNTHFGGIVAIEALAKTTDISALKCICATGSSSGTGTTVLWINGSTLRFSVFISGSQKLVTGAINVADGNWHHVAGVFDGTALRLYVDGVADSTLANGGSAQAFGNLAYVGSNSGTTDQFIGSLDEVAVYSSALSATRVQAHANAAATAFPTGSFTELAIDLPSGASNGQLVVADSTKAAGFGWGSVPPDILMMMGA